MAYLYFNGKGRGFFFLPFMAVKRKSAEQKQDEEESAQKDHLHRDGQLEMLSEEEDDDLVSDNGLVDDFPELNVQSDSDSSEVGYSTAENDDDSTKSSDDSESINLFPIPNAVVSGITNQPKLVYPEIEPGYDSDSSTEDVSLYLSL